MTDLVTCKLSIPRERFLLEALSLKPEVLGMFDGSLFTAAHVEWSALMMFAAAGGVVGGFAGGEAGLQQFIQEGEIKFKDPNEKGSLPSLWCLLEVFVGVATFNFVAACPLVGTLMSPNISIKTYSAAWSMGAHT